MKYSQRLDYARLAETLLERGLVAPEPVRELLQLSREGGMGFCEALVRVSVLKALPTAEEISRAGFETAYEHLEYLERRSKEKYARFLEENAVPWGAAPSQPVERCVRGLISIIVGRMESDADGEITDDDALNAWSERFELGPVHGRDWDL